MNTIKKNETVVLLHALAATNRFMNPLQKALIKENYHVVNIDYPSRKKSISDNATVIYQAFNQLRDESSTKVHFVAHSMGCIILRELLAKYPISHIGNSVMLAPPNQGSEVADFFRNNFVYKHFFGPAGLQLTTDFAKKNPFPKMHHPFGVIAGNVCLDPICYFILPKGNDGKVTIESTKLEGMCDHIILPCSHTFIIMNQTVISQVIYFLKNRHFNH